MAGRAEVLKLGDREVAISNPARVVFPALGISKLDLVRYYQTTAVGVLRGVAGRPMGLKRYVNGIEGEAFYQKRAPDKRPEWISTVELTYPSGRSAHVRLAADGAVSFWAFGVGAWEAFRYLADALGRVGPPVNGDGP